MEVEGRSRCPRRAEAFMTNDKKLLVHVRRRRSKRIHNVARYKFLTLSFSTISPGAITEWGLYLRVSHVIVVYNTCHTAFIDSQTSLPVLQPLHRENKTTMKQGDWSFADLTRTRLEARNYGLVEATVCKPSWQGFGGGGRHAKLRSPSNNASSEVLGPKVIILYLA